MSKAIAFRDDIYEYLNKIRNKFPLKSDGKKISFSDAFDKVRRHEKV